MGKHTAIKNLVFGVLLAAAALILPTQTENCSDGGFGQVCVQTVYTYFGMSAQTFKILLGIAGVLLIAIALYFLPRAKGPITAKARAGVRLLATTALPPSSALAIVREATAAVKGGGASVLSSGLQNLGAQVNIERESPERLGLSITSGKRIFELCTFSARAIGPRPDGKTLLHVGGLETYKTSQSRLFMIIPLGPTEIAGYAPYSRFLDVVAAALRNYDPSAQISIEAAPAS